MKQQAVIDGDNQIILEYFNQDETEKIFKKYKEDGRWEDVVVDGSGDIILWEDL